MNYLCEDEYEKIKKNVWLSYKGIPRIKISDAYKFDYFLNKESRNAFKELGRRINYILENVVSSDYDDASFSTGFSTSTGELFKCTPFIICNTKDSTYIIDFHEDNRIVVSSDNSDDKITYKMNGTKMDEDFKITKVTSIREEQLDSKVTYKALKDEHKTVYRIYDDEDKLEVGIGNENLVDEKKFISTIKNIGLNRYNIEYVFKKIIKNISLQKGKNQYLSIKMRKKDLLTDEIRVSDGEILAIKFLNNDIKYRFDADTEVGVYKYEYINELSKDEIHYSSSYRKQKLVIHTNKNQFEAMKLSKKVSDDINTQYQKVLTYMKK